MGIFDHLQGHHPDGEEQARANTNREPVEQAAANTGKASPKK